MYLSQHLITSVMLPVFTNARQTDTRPRQSRESVSHWMQIQAGRVYLVTEVSRSAYAYLQVAPDGSVTSRPSADWVQVTLAEDPSNSTFAMGIEPPPALSEWMVALPSGGHAIPIT